MTKRQPRGRPREERCYMDHPRTPENLTKWGSCKVCKRLNAKLTRDKQKKQETPLSARGEK